MLLLRAPDSPGPDRYEQALAQRGFEAVSAPVLHYDFVNQDVLRALAENPRQLAAWIFTSARAVESVARAAPPGGADRHRQGVAYVVGPRTAEAASRLGFHAMGQASGSASELARFIRAHHDPTNPHPLCFVSGDRRRHELPDQLEQAGIAFREIVGYRTRARMPDIDPAGFDAGVWFSPSGVSAVYVHSGAHDRAAWNSLPSIAIGPTTANALAAAGVPPKAIAAAPTPAAVSEATAFLTTTMSRHV
ncbi:MAG: uroporphyrinogen-III synthase [Bacteroidota bacterium]